ncbi:MAG: DNA-directed RNA polymerase subunit N [Nanohaloarchaea archaeon]|nr:DNA-directed RNA polymerase subunit N [Candidatus Nanohaloarchaea archaeon]
MIIPVRCMTCGAVIGGKWEKYKALVEGGKTPKDALDELGIGRYCCRSLFLTHVDLIDDVAKFKIVSKK